MKWLYHTSRALDELNDDEAIYEREEAMVKAWKESKAGKEYEATEAVEEAKKAAEAEEEARGVRIAAHSRCHESNSGNRSY